MIGYWLVSTRKKKKQIIKNISSSPQPIIPNMVEKNVKPPARVYWTNSFVVRLL